MHDNPLAETLQQVGLLVVYSFPEQCVVRNCSPLAQTGKQVLQAQVYDATDAGRVMWNDELPNGTVSFTLAHAKGLSSPAAMVSVKSLSSGYKIYSAFFPQYLPHTRCACGVL